MTVTDAELRAFWDRCNEAAGQFPLYVLNDAREVVRASMKDWVDMKARDFETRCRVGTVHVGKTWVSTVFLGIDYNHARVLDETLPTLCFETLIWREDGSEIFDRYSTWAEAEAGHAEAVAKVKEEMN